MSVQVSVMIVTYEPDIDKFIATLDSVINQKNVSFEIIISDDGSKKVDVSVLEKLASERIPREIPCVFIKNDDNVGTVLNIYNACLAAKGGFLKIISPGDMLFDDNVLRDIYLFAKNNPEKSFFFGKAVYYNNDESLIIYDKIKPSFPNIYDSAKFKKTIIAFMYGQSPIGASYFYKTDVFRKYICKVAHHVKYVEDYTTSILYLLDGGKLSFFVRKFVWYEMGSGISTKNKKKWEKLYYCDCQGFYSLTNQLYKDNIYLQFRFGGERKMVLHPCIFIRASWMRFISKIFNDRVNVSENEVLQLKKRLYIE